MEGSNLDRQAIRSTRVLGAVVASVCVMGLVGMLWLHGERPNLQTLPTEYAGAAMPTPAQSAFLHAPATDRSVPSADQVFATRSRVSEHDTPAAPTF